ncbi:MAG: FG-GAP repeat domain-containing protein [Thermoplasmatota archaeon]
MRGLILAAAVALVAGAFAGLGDHAAAGDGAFAHEVAFLTTDSAHPVFPWQAFDGSNLVIYDVNGDGAPEIVASNDNLHHYVIDPRLGRVVAELSGYHPGGELWAGRELDGPAIGRVDGNANVSVVIEDGASYLSKWTYTPNGSTLGSYLMQKQWEVFVNARDWDARFNVTHPYNTEDVSANEAHPYLADVNGDGRLEIFAQADNVAAEASYAPNGTLRWGVDPPVDSNAGAIVADLNGDGKLEAIFASDGGPVYVRDASSGRLIWAYDTRCSGGAVVGDGSNCDWTQAASVTLSPTVADLFGDGRKEICFGTRQTIAISDPGWYHPATVQANVDASHAKLFCLTHDGKLLWSQQFPWGNPHVAMHPIPFDVNGDGVRDLIWTDWNTIGHIPGNWETTTRGPNLFALDGRDGHVLWHVGLNSGWSNKDVALADVYGDGRQLLLADSFGTSGGDGIGVFDPANGVEIGWAPIRAGWSATRGPLVGDLFHDGGMDIVIPVMRPAASNASCPEPRPDLPCREGAIEILSTGQPMSSAFTDVFTWNLAIDHVFDKNATVHSAVHFAEAQPGRNVVPALLPVAVVACAALAALLRPDRRRGR